jgi:hypothetical protein
MTWLSIGGAFVASAVATSLSDWYFFGVLFHSRYLKTPGVWKAYRDRKDEQNSLVMAQAVLTVSTLVFILVCAHQGWVSAGTSIPAAIILWVMVPLPLIVVNAIYIPMDRWLVVSHSLGWLARLIITALLVSWFL